MPVSAIEILGMLKTAGMSQIAVHTVDNLSGDAYLAAREVAKHFKVSHSDNVKLLTRLGLVHNPTFSPILVSKNFQGVPNFDVYSNKVNSSTEPWAYMHELGHKIGRKDYIRKLQAIFPWKTKIKRADENLFGEYITKNYMSGSQRSKEIGQRLQDLVYGTKQFKEKETMDFLEEIRASALAIKNTERLHSAKIADKVFQPMSVLDAGAVRAWEYSRR